MPEIMVRIPNMKAIQKAFALAPILTKKAIQGAVAMAGFQLEKETKTVISTGKKMWKPPVDTGRMRTSIDVRLQPMTAVVGPHTDYAIFVHEGTRRMLARPFMKIGLEEANKEIQEIFKDAMEGVFKKIARKSRLKI